MKTILELLSTFNEKGESDFFEVKDKINTLLGLKNVSFELSESTSRPYEEGPLSDLRTSPLPTSDVRIEQIRALLLDLNEKGHIQFEQKINQETQQISFIITHINENILSYKSDPMQLDASKVSSEEMVTVRFGIHNFHVKYIKLNKAGANEITNVEKTTEISPVSNNSFFVSPFMNPNKKSVISLLVDWNNFNLIKSQLNKCFELSPEQSFQLYVQSSHPEYPIDLRVYLPKNDRVTATMRKKMEGFSLLDDVTFEEKISGDEIALIIKEINPQSLKNILKEQKEKHYSINDVEIILSLLKGIYPENKWIQDSIVVDGTESRTRPYPHIRSKDFHNDIPPLNIENSFLAVFKDSLDVDYRPSTVRTVKREKYIQIKPSVSNQFSFISNQTPFESYQLIVDIKNMDALAEQLFILTSSPDKQFNLI